MEEEDAVALLLKSAAQEATIGTEQIATEIVKALHYLPLAIVQAGAFISKSQDLDSYLALYTRNQARLLSESLLSLMTVMPGHYAAKYTFPSPLKGELQVPLEFLSHFLRQNGEWDSLQFLDVTNEIQAYSLISFDAEKKLFSIHPLVHAWSQTTKLPLIFRHQFISIFWEGGKYKQTERLLEEVLKKQKQLLGDDHPDTLGTMGNLANIYSDLGELRKAKELSVIVLEKQKQLLGDDHSDTLRTMSNLARTYSALGEHGKAKELKGIALEKQKQLLGDNHPDILQTMGSLASTYSALGEHWKAKELKDIVLENRNSCWGTAIQTPCVPWSGQHLLSSWRALEGQRTQGYCAGETEPASGNSHPNTLRTMSNLASTYSALGEHGRPKNSRVLCWRDRKQLLGDNHPDILQTMGSLASTYSALGEHWKAKELKGIVLEKQKQLLGNSHPNTLRTMSNLASTYLALGEHGKAKELKGIVLEKQK
ncbi:hypothetical protein B0H14DRAFT_3140449 [Mycena olivaceomarginata]|nr:hypothetical protein B0H14DRAFT_3140449 [Mycena olivaceomarginata]